MTKAFTAVFLNVTPEEAGEITSHPKWSAGSWSHALDDRNAAQLDAERAREERNREHVRLNAEWMAKCEELRKEREWQSIETAPKDGTPLMLFARHVDAEAPIRVVGWYLDDDGWIDSVFRPNNPQKLVPYFWMPLPHFPKKEGA